MGLFLLARIDGVAEVWEIAVRIDFPEKSVQVQEHRTIRNTRYQKA